MRVFISHSSKDKPRVEELAVALRERGFDPWLDKWEITAGDDIVASINAGLEEASVGIVVFSAHTDASNWVKAEVSYLTYARATEDKVLIPVLLDEDGTIPPLLRPLARRGIDEIDAIADALLARKGGPPVSPHPSTGRIEEVTISLSNESAGAGGESGVHVELRINDTVHGKADFPSIPDRLLRASDAFLRHRVVGPRRDLEEATRTALDARLAELGREMRAFCLPGSSGEALAEVLDGCQIGTTVQVSIETDGPHLLGLPFEALRLPDDRLLATQPSCVMLRQPSDVTVPGQEPLAGPLKILIAVGAPDEDKTDSPVLDHERELQSILDAVESLNRLENAEVRILEVGHPEQIAKAIESDAYHVLHLSCHGSPGNLELETEDGDSVKVTAEDLIGPLKATGRPVPMMFLNSCHGAVGAGQTGSLAEELLRAGVPAVLAMQKAVTDDYATRLARSFYENLARREDLLASRALARARCELEQQRQQAIQQNDSGITAQPEYSTATLFVAGNEPPLANFALDKQPLRTRPVHESTGPIPHLRIDEFIGRRQQLRECVRILRAKSARYSGVVLAGIGGVGKSALAGRATMRLREDGALVAIHPGRFELAAVVKAVREELTASPFDWAAAALAKLDRAHRDQDRLQQIARLLTENRLVLVLDDFEKNLTLGGDEFLNPEVAAALKLLGRATRSGRLLITCRHPIPGFDKPLKTLRLGPLSQAERRKLALRLDALNKRGGDDAVRIDAAQRARILRLLGGHPRSLEFVNVLLGGEERQSRHLLEKLEALARDSGIDPEATTEDAEQALMQTLALGARDLMLEQMMEIVRNENLDSAYLQTSVSNLPVAASGLARMLATTDASDPGDAPAAERAIRCLQDLALLHRNSDDGAAWVDRWIAERLSELEPEGHSDRCIRAGHYRGWRIQHDKTEFSDAIEATRNFLAGGDFHMASMWGKSCLDVMLKMERSIDIAAFASEILEQLPEAHPGFTSIAHKEAQAHLALGQTAAAFRRYQALLARQEQLARAEPDRADYQRDLSVSYNKMGDLFSALGQGEQARQAYQKDLEIAERLARAEPDRADYQRDLSVSYNKMGDLYRALGQGEQARQAYLQALEIAERLARAEPDRADYQRDLSVSHERMGDLFSALGQGDQARQAFLQALEIRERLARAEPDRADYQRDLSVSYNKMGDLYRALGQGEQARQAFLQALEIRERLARAEPDRADYQRDLAVSNERMAAVDKEDATRWLNQAVEIRRRMADLAPNDVIVIRELAITLLQQGQASEDGRAFAEGASILVELYRQGVLEAQYHDLAKQLESLADENKPDSDD